MKEHGYRVRGRSTKVIAFTAESFLRRHAPERLSIPGPVDLAELVDHGLQRDGIMVYGVDPEELPDAEAETRATAGRWLEIWMRSQYFAALFERNSDTNRARSTLAHEIGHAILHREEVRTGRHLPHLLALRRAPRSELKTFEDSEWQAFAFAGALLMPRPVLRGANLADSGAIADRFEVSEALARFHVGLLQRTGAL